jgi:hypothetical protein
MTYFADVLTRGTKRILINSIESRKEKKQIAMDPIRSRDQMGSNEIN